MFQGTVEPHEIEVYESNFFKPIPKPARPARKSTIYPPILLSKDIAELFVGQAEPRPGQRLLTDADMSLD